MKYPFQPLKIRSTALAALLSCLPSLAVAAGTDISGGGNALVCFDTPAIPKQIRARDAAGNIIDGSIRNEHISHITRIELLDLMEAQYRKGLGGPASKDLIEPRAEESFEDYARRIFDRLSLPMPKLADVFKEQIQLMPATEAIGQPDGLYPVDDYNLSGRIDSTHCVVGTIAIHQIERDEFSLRYDERLMHHPLHSRQSQYATYLHELVYSSIRRARTETDSRNTRAIVGALLRKNLPTAELLKTLSSTGVMTKKDYGRWDRLGYDLNKFGNELKANAKPAIKEVLLSSELKVEKLFHENRDSFRDSLDRLIDSQLIFDAITEITRELPDTYNQLLAKGWHIESLLDGKDISWESSLNLYGAFLAELREMSQLGWPQGQKAAKAKALLKKFDASYLARTSTDIQDRCKEAYKREFENLFNSKWREALFAHPTLPVDQRAELESLLRSNLDIQVAEFFQGNRNLAWDDRTSAWDSLNFTRLNAEALSKIAPDFLTTPQLLP